MATKEQMTVHKALAELNHASIMQFVLVRL